jgi:RNA recognition motif-containing protein
MNEKVKEIVKVRELRIENLPDPVSEIEVYKQFFMFGEIEFIDLSKDKVTSFI